MQPSWGLARFDDIGTYLVYTYDVHAVSAVDTLFGAGASAPPAGEPIWLIGGKEHNKFGLVPTEDRVTQHIVCMVVHRTCIEVIQ